MIQSYRIFHKPTGMYYRKSKADNKTNLSKIGNVFMNKPDLSRVLGDTYWHPMKSMNNVVEEKTPVDLNEWVIVPFDPMV